MEFAGKPMIVSSFVDDTLFAPVPGSKADNKSRYKYNAYLENWKRIENRDEKLISFLEWIRKHTVAQFDVLQERDGQTFLYEIKERSKRRRGANKDNKAIGVKFAWELLDIFIGNCLAMFVPHRDEHEFLLKAEGDDSVVCADGDLEDHRAPAAETPEGTAFVNAALAHSYFKPKPGAMHEGRPQTSVDVLVEAIKLDLKLRGISRGRRFYIQYTHLCNCCAARTKWKA